MHTPRSPTQKYASPTHTIHPSNTTSSGMRLATYCQTTRFVLRMRLFRHAGTPMPLALGLHNTATSPKNTSPTAKGRGLPQGPCVTFNRCPVSLGDADVAMRCRAGGSKPALYAQQYIASMPLTLNPQPHTQLCAHVHAGYWAYAQSCMTAPMHRPERLSFSTTTVRSQ